MCTQARLCMCAKEQETEVFVLFWPGVSVAMLLVIFVPGCAISLDSVWLFFRHKICFQTKPGGKLLAIDIVTFPINSMVDLSIVVFTRG